jgi:hypothetical protein
MRPATSREVTKQGYSPFGIGGPGLWNQIRLREYNDLAEHGLLREEARYMGSWDGSMRSRERERGAEGRVRWGETREEAGGEKAWGDERM